MRLRFGKRQIRPIDEIVNWTPIPA